MKDQREDIYRLERLLERSIKDGIERGQHSDMQGAATYFGMASDILAVLAHLKRHEPRGYD